MSHPILGGPILYSSLYPDMPPHNYFLTAFINSGLVGGFVATILYFWVVRDSIKILLRPNPSGALLLATAAGVMIYSVNSLFHNQSIISGDTLFFILYPLMKKVDIIEKKHLKV
jgi:O-antigen ligase